MSRFCLIFVFASLWLFSVDPASRTPRLVDCVECLHAIGQTAFRSLPSASMKAIGTKPNPGHFRQFRHVFTLRSLQSRLKPQAKQNECEFILNECEAEWMWSSKLLFLCCCFAGRKPVCFWCFKQIWGFNIFLDVRIKSTRGPDFKCSALFITSCVLETESGFMSHRFTSAFMIAEARRDRRVSASVKYDYHSISPGFCEHEEFNKDMWRLKIQKQTFGMQN